MANVIIIIVVIGIIGAAIRYLYKQKKKGATCLGCSNCQGCKKSCSCTGAEDCKETKC